MVLDLGFGFFNNLFYNQLKPGAKAWSVIKFVRGIAIDCMLAGTEKVTRVRWLASNDIVYNCPKSGVETLISLEMVRSLAESFDSRASAILTELNVPELSQQQVGNLSLSFFLFVTVSVLLCHKWREYNSG